MQKLLVIVGPTSSNKTKLSIQLANKFDGEIINADAYQVYKELNIGVNKPTTDELKQAKFHLISEVSILDKWDIKRFQDRANLIISKIHSRNKLPILVGGSHLYIDALTKNYALKSMPERNNQFTDFTNDKLYNLLLKLQPVIAKKIGINNRNRLIRALQIASNNKTMNQRDTAIYDTMYISCTKHRAQLYNDINKHVDFMISHGWFEETKQIIQKFSEWEKLNALKAIGYAEIANGLLNPTKGINIEKIKQQTRQYAKRQLTWIRHHYLDAVIFDQTNVDEISNLITKWICR